MGVCQPLYHFQPAFERFEDLPLVTRSQRCEATGASCLTLEHDTLKSTMDRVAVFDTCAAEHSEMDGDDVGVATFSGFSEEQVVLLYPIHNTPL